SGGAWAGIYLNSGNANIGNITGNTIGSGTGTGSVTINTPQFSLSGAQSYGIYCDADNTTSNISGNTIGSITTSCGSSAISHGIIAIDVISGGSPILVISNNLIGSTTTSNSINASTASIDDVAQRVSGIELETVATITISGNTIANLNNAYANTPVPATSTMNGISVASATGTISGNVI